MKKVKLWTALVLIVLILVVVFQNRDPVATRFLFATIIMPRAALLTITLLIGVAIGILVSLGLSSHLPGKKK
jgi:uncharacterized integral membrane protein